MLCTQGRASPQGAKSDRVLITVVPTCAKDCGSCFFCNYFLPHCDSRNDTESYFLTEEKKKNRTRLVEVKKKNKTEVHMVLSRRAGNSLNDH